MSRKTDREKGGGRRPSYRRQCFKTQHHVENILTNIPYIAYPQKRGITVWTIGISRVKPNKKRKGKNQMLGIHKKDL